MKSLNNKGIKLIEISAVLVVSIVVAVVIYPTFNRAREALKVPDCENNMKQCAVALLVYLQDYDDHLPSSALVNHDKKWNNEAFLKFGTKTGDLPPRPGFCPQTWPEILCSYMKCKDAIFCPSDRVDISGSNINVSYYWKQAIDRAWYGEHCKKPCRIAADFPHSEDKIILFERSGFHMERSSGLKNGVQIMVACLDSHVKTITIENATSGDPANCAANSDGEPMYFNYDNKTQKQIDGNTPAKFIDPARYSDKF